MRGPLRIAGLVLAAGASRRMGRCKLLLPWPCPQSPGGRVEPLIVPVLRAAKEAGLSPLLAVIRPPEAQQKAFDEGSGDTPDEAGSRCSQQVSQLCRVILAQWQDPGSIVEAPLAHLGQAESLKAGIRELLRREANGEPACAGALVLLGDQPLLRAPLLKRLIAAFAADPARAIAPVCDGQRGNPVLLPRRAFSDVLTLCGDTGARELLGRYGLRLVLANDTATLQDVDTPEEYARLLPKQVAAPEAGGCPRKA